MEFDPLSFSALIVGLLLGLTTHEFMHAYVADRLGDYTARGEGRLTLNPAAHIDPVFTLALPVISFLASGGATAIGAAKPVPFNPWALRWGKFGAALVALAGPMTNLALAAAFAMWYRFMDLTPVSSVFIGTIITVNVSLFVFNLIPFPPLDGSRVLYAFAPAPVREVMDRIEQMGIVALLLLFFLLYPILLSPIVTTLVRGVINILVPIPAF